MPPYKHTGNIPRLCNARTDMVEECTAPNISGLNSTQSPYPNTVTAQKESPYKTNENTPKNNEKRSETIKKSNIPSLGIAKDAFSDSSTRFHSNVESSMQPTSSFRGNLYLSNNKIKSGQAYVKKSLPQAHHETLIQSPFVSNKTQRYKSNSKDISNKIDLNQFPVPSSFSNSASVVQRNCEQTEDDENVEQSILPPTQLKGGNEKDENTKRKQNNHAAFKILPKNELVSSIQLKLQNEKSYFPHVISSEHVPLQHSTATHIQGSKKSFQQQLAPLNFTQKINGVVGVAILENTNDVLTKQNAIHSNNLYANKKSNISSTMSKENNMNNEIKAALESLKDKGTPNFKNVSINSSSKSNTRTELNLKVSTHPAGIVTHQAVTEEFQTEEERNRMKLINTYGPYLIPSDTSLNAARARLKRAIAQTRELRASFSARVYEKYRIVLRPVPKTADEIIDPLKKNPRESKAKIIEKINLIKAEKEAEKKEIPNRAAIISNSLMSGEQIYGVSSSASASNIAESEQLFTAGLSLVILPEEEVDSSQYNLEDYEHRGPTDPETGQRLGGISSAAAAAAEALLDKTRRGITYRMERRRRNMNAGMNLSSDGSNIPLNQYINSSRDMLNPIKTDKSAPPVYSMSKGKIAKSTHITSNKQTSRRQSCGKGASASSISPWGPKRRVSKSIAVGNTNSLLSISANVEGRKKAAAMVIHSYCPKFSGTSSRSSSNHSRSKQIHHPHPESKGGIAFSASFSNSSKKNSFVASTKFYPLALPHLQHSRKRKRVSESLENNYQIAKNVLKNNAIEAIGSVLDQFYCTSGELTVDEPNKKSSIIGDQTNNKGNKFLTSSSLKPKLLLHEADFAAQKDTEIRKATPIHAKGIIKSKRKRKVTEIGLLRVLRHLEVPIRDIPTSTKQGNNERGPSSHVFDGIIDGKPNYNLAFSVLYALGIVGNSNKNDAKQTHVSLDNPSAVKSLMLNNLNLSQDEDSCFERRMFSYDILDHWNTIMKNKVNVERSSKQHKMADLNVAGNEAKRKSLNLNRNNKKNSGDDCDLSKQRKNNEGTFQPCHHVNKATMKSVKPQLGTSKEDEKSAGVKEIEESRKIKEKNNKASNNLIKQSQAMKKNAQKRNWETISGLRGDLTHPQQQHLTTQHHTQSQFIPSMQFGATSVYNSSPQNPNRIGLSPIDHRLNHVRLLGNNRHGNHLNTLSFGEAINRNSASPVYHAEYFHGNNQIHPAQTRSFGSSSDWPHLGILTSPPSMMGGIDLATSQAHAMIGHSAQAIRNQHHIAAVRNIAASISAQQANLLMSNARVPNGGTFQQQRLQQISSRPQLQGAGDEIPMMSSSGLLMTSQRALGESFSSLTSPQTPSLMYLAASKDSSSPYMNRSASVTTPANSLQITNPRVMNSVGQLKKKRGKPLQSDEKSANVKVSIEPDSKNNLKNEKIGSKTQSSGASSDLLDQKVSKNITKDVRPTQTKPKNTSRETESFRPQNKKASTTDNTNQMTISELTSTTEGMRFFIPAIPSGLSEVDANLILKGYFHKITANVDKSKALEFLLAVGTAVPIPRTLISSPLKERLSGSSRVPGNALQGIQKDVSVPSNSMDTFFLNSNEIQFSHFFLRVATGYCSCCNNMALGRA